MTKFVTRRCAPIAALTPAPLPERWNPGRSGHETSNGGLDRIFATPALADFTATPHAPPPQEVIDLAQMTRTVSCLMISTPVTCGTGATLSANARLHLIPCQMAAYNMAVKVILERKDDESDTSTWDTLSFARYSDELGWSASDMLINADIDAETGRLTEFGQRAGHWRLRISRHLDLEWIRVCDDKVCL